MRLSEERLATLLEYCRIETPSAVEVALLEGLYESAKAYLTNAGVTEPPEDSPRRAQYDLCIGYMVLDSYDLRDETITGTIVSENPAFRRLLNQLKWTEPVQAGPAGAAAQREFVVR